MNWFHRMFKPAPATLDEGVADFEACPWSEAELVAWLNDQDKELQANAWNAISADLAAGLSRTTILRSLSCLRKRMEASTPSIWWQLLDTYWEMRTGWWLSGLMNGTNKPIRVKVD